MDTSEYGPSSRGRGGAGRAGRGGYYQPRGRGGGRDSYSGGREWDDRRGVGGYYDQQGYQQGGRGGYQQGFYQGGSRSRGRDYWGGRGGALPLRPLRRPPQCLGAAPCRAPHPSIALGLSPPHAQVATAAAATRAAEAAAAGPTSRASRPESRCLTTWSFFLTSRATPRRSPVCSWSPRPGSSSRGATTAPYASGAASPERCGGAATEAEPAAVRAQPAPEQAGG